jgi:hypothetical protein
VLLRRRIAFLQCGGQSTGSRRGVSIVWHVSVSHEARYTAPAF